MRLPKYIDVGPTRYPIVKGSKDMEDRGWFIYDKGIVLAPGMLKDMEAEVLLHEVFHAIMYTFNITDYVKDKLEEKLVTDLSTALATVIRQNPKLVKYLQERLK